MLHECFAIGLLIVIHMFSQDFLQKNKVFFDFFFLGGGGDFATPERKTKKNGPDEPTLLEKSVYL